MTSVYKIKGKNCGKDVSITITDSLKRTYNAAQIGILTEFDVKAEYKMDETESIVNGGQTFYETLPHGAKCSMKFSRSTGALEDIEADYRAQSRLGNQLTYQIQYMTKNRDNTINIRTLIDCKPHNFDLGSYKAGPGSVNQSVDFVSTDLENSGPASGIFSA